MLTYKELQQLLKPIRVQSQNSNNLGNSKKIEESNKQKINQTSLSKKKINQSVNEVKNEEKKGDNGNKIENGYELILSHRELKNIPVSIPFSEYKIQKLDLSFNFIKDLKIIKEKQNKDLQYLGLSFNFIKTLQNIGKLFTNLKIIDLNANRIESMNIKQQEFGCLQALYLKNNKIKYFLYCPKSVQILCLDHNELKQLAFKGGNNLQILSASFNKIQQFQIQQHQNNYICFLDLEDNLLHDMEKFKKILLSCKNLLSINMIGNYLSRISHKKYMIQILTISHNIIRIDQQYINPHVREAFKIMKEEDLVEMQMKETEEKYLKRMEEQLKLKQQMMNKIREKQRELDDNFEQFMKREKQQMDVLEGYAKNNMGKKKFAVIEQNKQFKQLVGSYKKEEHRLPKTDRDNGSRIEMNSGEDGKQIKQMGQSVIEKHKDEYIEYKKSMRNSRAERKESKIRSYSKISNKKQRQLINGDDDQEMEQFSQEQLSNEQIERRKKNMRNPSLVYRNSNQLIGIKQIIIEQEIKKQGDDEVLNPKCLPYLVRKYGFHTIV